MLKKDPQKRPPFTLVEAKLPQKAQYVISYSPQFFYACGYKISKNIEFTLTNFKEEEGKVSLNLTLRNNTKKYD